MGFFDDVDGGAGAQTQSGQGPGGGYTLQQLQALNQQNGWGLTDLSPWVGQTDAVQNITNSLQQNGWKPPAQQPAAPAGGAQTQQDFGDLGNAQNWMNLVNDPTKLQAWIKQNNPGWSDQLVSYYAGVIKGQPGANATEQAGSAQYYLDKFKNDPFYGGSGERPGGGGGGAGAGGFGSFTPYTPEAVPDYLQQPYTLPTEEQFMSSPGVRAGLAAAQQGQERSAAAKGSILAGGFQKALGKYLDDYASQKYGDYVNQTLAQRGQQFGEYQGLEGNRYRNWQGNTAGQNTADTNYWQRLATLTGPGGAITNATSY